MCPNTCYLCPRSVHSPGEGGTLCPVRDEFQPSNLFNLASPPPTYHLLLIILFIPVSTSSTAGWPNSWRPIG